MSKGLSVKEEGREAELDELIISSDVAFCRRRRVTWCICGPTFISRVAQIEACASPGETLQDMESWTIFKLQTQCLIDIGMEFPPCFTEDQVGGSSPSNILSAAQEPFCAKLAFEFGPQPAECSETHNAIISAESGQPKTRAFT